MSFRSTNKKTQGFQRSQSVKKRRNVSLEQQLFNELWRFNNPATKKFTSAIRSFDIDPVENLLKTYIEIEYIMNSNRSALHLAVELIETGTISSLSLKSDPFNLNSISLDRLERPEALRRIVEVLIESGRSNVNALTESSETVLHLVVGYCSCRQFSDDYYKAMVNATIELLLKNNADINAKTNSGETPLMKASEKGCNHILKLLLDWRDELGAGVDFNARDRYGQTALIKASKSVRVDVVDSLLKHGCRDIFQDHRGFYALHAVINGNNDSSGYARSDFLELIGAIASEETHMNLNPGAAHSSFGEAMLIDWTRNDAIQKTVSMLVTRGRADINAKDFRGNTVLDLALKLKHCTNQKTVDMLKEYGSTFRHPVYTRTTFLYTDRVGKTPLHRLFDVQPNRFVTLREQLDFFRHCLNNSPHKEAFDEMTVIKDCRGRTALHCVVISLHQPYVEGVNSEDIYPLINVLKLIPNINERDNYGRTPLHYCERADFYESLVEQGADEQIRDNDGKTPRDLNKLRDDENQRQIDVLINQSICLFDAWEIWKGSEFAYRDQFSIKVSDKVCQFMNRLSHEISKMDPRFECRPVLIGSAGEETKTGLPDEFDFNFVLTKFSKLCEVVPSPEVPSGFVHLKRKSYHAECWPENQHIGSEEKFDEFYHSGFLLTAKIACRFRILTLQVLSESEFWKGDDFLELHPCSEVSMRYVKQESYFTGSHIKLRPVHKDLDPSNHPCSTIQLKLNRPIEGRYMFTRISLDVVPCLKINGWWPENTLTSLSDKIKCEGCHLVFDQPQRKYPWVPFSDPFARISFAPAESRLIKECCSAVARAAYMVGKQLLHDEPQFTYVLKNCLLYCFEALKDSTNSSPKYEDLDPPELRYFVEKLMLCFYEFYVQAFLPCYMMPSFHVTIDCEFLFSQDLHQFNLKSRGPSFVYGLYEKFCTTDSPVYFCPPIPDPLNENFNRDNLMRKLSMDRSYIHNGCIYPRFFATGETFRFDSQTNWIAVQVDYKRKVGEQIYEDMTGDFTLHVGLGFIRLMLYIKQRLGFIRLMLYIKQRFLGVYGTEW